MAKEIPVELPTRSFANKKEATEFFKVMLNNYAPGEVVGDEDSLHLSALLERHDEYVQKVGTGVERFEVMMTEHGTQCFRIVRKDGTGTDFRIDIASHFARPLASRRSVRPSARRCASISSGLATSSLRSTRERVGL